MKRFAAIDIGTNSTKMTIADAQGGTLSLVSEASEVTRLGEGVDADKRLSDNAMARTLSVLARFAAEAKAAGVEKTVCAGTSALRDASNGPGFLSAVRHETGLEIEIITGDREAQLAYAAVHADPDLGLPPDYPVLVFDIGGGSTELTLAGSEGIMRHESLQMGAVRVTERFLRSDPPTDTEIAQAEIFITEAFAAFPSPAATPILVGIGGTAVNAAAVTVSGDATKPDSVHASLLFARDIEAALVRFRAVPLAERRLIAGLEPKRADVIIGGVLILRALLVHFSSDRFLVSARGLRYGLLAEAAATDA